MTLAVGLVPALALLSAAAGGGLPLRFEGCPDRQVGSVRNLVAIELGQKDTSRVSAVEIFCRGNKALLMTSGEGEPLVRWIDLRATGDSGRSRLLALSIAELVAAQQAAPKPEPPPAPVVEEKKVEPPPEPPKPLEPLPPEPAQLRLNAAGQVRAFPGGLALLGIGAQVARGAPGQVGWRADVMVEGGLAPLQLGQVEASAVGVGLGALFNAARIGAFDLEAAVGFRGGWARLEGVPVDLWVPKLAPKSGAWVGPFFGLRMLWSKGRVGVEFGLEGGAVLVPLRSGITNPEEAGIFGGWLGLQVAAGLLP
jgi:hypothetical protein